MVSENNRLEWERNRNDQVRIYDEKINFFKLYSLRTIALLPSQETAGLL